MKADDSNWENYALLGNKIIIVAFSDYTEYHRRLKHCMQNDAKTEEKDLRNKIKKIEEFFDSNLIDIYTQVPRDTLKRKLNQIKRKYKECYDGQ